MDIAIVTGASSALGLAISRRLIELGFRVYGLGGDYKECSLQNVNFKPVSCDLADPIALQTACLKILEKEKGVYLLVNNAKYFGNNAFEEMGLQEMERIIRINLLCPLVLMRIFGKSLCSLQGYVIQLGAPFSESSRGGPAGAASAGGMKWMGEQLFNEHRERGLKVCYLSPEPNRTQDARKRIRHGARPEAAIDPEAIAQAVEQILQSPYGNVVTEMIIRPLRIDEPEHDPVWKIPYPDPQPIPYTVPREMIEAEEQLEEEEWKKKQELKRKRRAAPKKAAGDKPAPNEPQQASGQTEQKQDKAADAPPSGNNKRRKSRRKPKPSRQVVGFHDRKETSTESGPDQKRDGRKEDNPGKSESTESGDPKAAKSSKKIARKRPARKTAGKTDNLKSSEEAGKPAAKQAKKSARKTSKKTATTKKAARKTSRKGAAKKASKPTGKDENHD